MIPYPQFRSCSLVLQGRMFVLGGSGFSKRQVVLLKTNSIFTSFQIAEVSAESCSISTQSERVLPFNFEYGACASINNNSQAVLCFDEITHKDCQVTETPDFDVFEDIEQSFYSHRHTRIAASSKFILALGSSMPSNAKAETFDLDQGIWKEMPVQGSTFLP